MIKLITKYKGSLKLSAIGDALGWMTEFAESRAKLKSRFGTDYIENYYSWSKRTGGRFYGYIDNIALGSYSDDTQMSLCVARCIKNGGFVDNDRFADVEMRDWMMYQRGAGHTVKTAAKNLQKRSVHWYNNFYKDNTTDYLQAGANGAAMRMLPIALTNIGDDEECMRQIFLNSIITHGHPRAIIGAMLYGYVASHIITLQPEYFSWESFLTNIGQHFPSAIALKSLKSDNIIMSWIDNWNAGDLSFEDVYCQTQDEVVVLLREIFLALKYEQDDESVLTKLGCYAKETKGSGTSTVAAGIYLALKYAAKPQTAILCAVNSIGTDTDSIAAFVGGMLGALHGKNVIPSKWQDLQDSKYIEGLAERLLAVTNGNVDENIPNIVSTSFEKDLFNVGDTISMASLGMGKITNVNRQPTLMKSKYNLILDVVFDDGLTIRLTKLFSCVYGNQKNIKQSFSPHVKSNGIVKNIVKLQGVATSHGEGIKKVLCTNAEAASYITQIAVTTLQAGDAVEAHVHEEIEEHFIFEEGEVELYMDGECTVMKAGTYAMVPCGVKYGMRALTDCKIITIGCVRYNTN